MINRSNPSLDNQVQVSFLLHQEIWQRFEAKCKERGITTPEVLIGFVINFVKQTEKSSFSTSRMASLETLETVIDDYLQEKIERYLEEYLKTKISPLIEDYINVYLDGNSEDTANTSSIEEQSAVDVSSDLQPQSIPSHFKTAKELAKILGVSAPYITTLNRIGELKQWGWEDSGQRRGKTILYKPIHQ